MSAAWVEFLAESRAQERASDRDRGLTYSPDPRATDAVNVREYLAGFGWRGVGLGEVSRMTGAAKPNVRAILQAMVRDGDLRVEETNTRGPNASRRKTYFTDTAPTVQLMTPEAWDCVPA